ncbi:MAG: anti-sigma factor family protein [Gammaproteobacteria bacterium]
MTLRTLQTDDHHQVLMLLPWYINHSLEAAERQQVESHVRRCMSCRRELVQLERLVVEVKQASDLDLAAELSFEKVRSTLTGVRQDRELPRADNVIDLAKAKKPDGGITRRKPFERLAVGVRVGLATAATLLLVAVPLLIHLEQKSADYYTLSAARVESSDTPTLRVVFKTLLPNNEIDALLAQIHGRRVRGPNSVGAYTVNLDNGKDAPTLQAAIEFLRSQHNVMLAEPVLN